MTKNLPTEVLLSVLNIFPSELDKFSFAYVNKRHWRICSSPTADTLKLKSTITALQLRKYCAFIIKFRYCDKKYMKHVFLQAASLHTITLDDRQKLEEDEMDNVSGDEQLIDIAKIVPPEAVERAKNILRRDYYLPNRETIVMKDNLSYMIASPIK
ncbi:uncharacterized protein EV154DRAFT_560296 [Mucor mucedo]|uniref:uncharacterized protein n=1 Tax=Mucor mucedo TaxID=29922 RepID=UPI002220AEC7|nr:uncharacterized protein EV154DRAFT_560296 [Mucor mucedo]KAI7894648.1 hypothetical protein EV154DRAFT_560296 [Mucor mucedo]